MIEPRMGPCLVRALALLSVIQLFHLTAFGAPDNPPTDPRWPGTIRMAQRLRELADGVNVMNNPFQNVQRAEVLRPLVAAEKDPTRRSELWWSFANELLDSGRNAEALQ